MWEKRKAYSLFVGKIPLGRPRRRWMHNIKMDLIQIGLNGVDWISLVQDRNKWRALVNSAMNHRVLSNAGKISSGYTTGSFSRSAELHRGS
jgi:hypothetical protein